MWMLARYPATKMSSFVFLTPVFALLFGAGWLGEPITAGPGGCAGPGGGGDCAGEPQAHGSLNLLKTEQKQPLALI